MNKRNNLMSYFNNQSKFNEEEKYLLNSLEKNNDDCQNIDFNHLFSNGALPIHYACLYNSTKYLMNINMPHTQINSPGGAYNSTPIMFTIHRSNYKVLLSLLLNGADVFKKNSRSLDMLSFCVRYDDLLGLILVLSFIGENIPIKRYLRYSRKKNSELTREFLTERRSEIEGKVYKKNNSWKIFTFSNFEFIFSWLFIVLCLIFVDFKWLFAAFYFFVFYPLIISTPIPTVIHLIFHIYAYYNVIVFKFNNYSAYAFLLGHLISCLTFYLIKTPYLEINKIKEVQPLITDQVLKDEYNTEKFCQKCLRKKLIGNNHCDKCNRCVFGHIYHSTLFNKCISTKKNKGAFDFYNLFSVVLYSLVYNVTRAIDIDVAFVFMFPLVWHFITLFKFQIADHNRNKKISKYLNSFDDTTFLEKNHENTDINVRLPSALDEFLENVASI